MREIRTSGSVRDEGGNVLVYSACYLEDRSSFIEMMEAGVGISLQRTVIELEMFAWPLSLAVGRVGKPYGGRGSVA